MHRIEHARAHMQRATEILSRKHGFGFNFTSSAHANPEEWDDVPESWPKKGNAWWYSYDADTPWENGLSNGNYPPIYISR